MKDKQETNHASARSRSNAGLEPFSTTEENMIPRTQAEHNAINVREYPGTRQLCIECAQPTERCEEDAIYTEAGYGPLCIDCWRTPPELVGSNASAQPPLPPTWS